jgi:hypothetical protein
MALFSLTEEWTIEIGEDFDRRVEDGSLVLSHDERAIWVDIFDDDREPAEKMVLLQEDVPENANIWEYEQEGLLKFGYLERDEENENFELTTFTVGPTSYALMTFYFDEEKQLDWALKRWRSVRFLEV